LFSAYTIVFPGSPFSTVSNNRVSRGLPIFVQGKHAVLTRFVRDSQGVSVFLVGKHFAVNFKEGQLCWLGRERYNWISFLLTDLVDN
jgi:hypothetical protein